jgi:hypothetical protein
VASAQNPCAIWLPPGTPLFQGLDQIITRWRTVAGSPSQ